MCAGVDARGVSWEGEFWVMTTKSCGGDMTGENVASGEIPSLQCRTMFQGRHSGSVTAAWAALTLHSQTGHVTSQEKIFKIIFKDHSVSSSGWTISRIKFVVLIKYHQVRVVLQGAAPCVC